MSEMAIQVKDLSKVYKLYNIPYSKKKAGQLRMAQLTGER